MALRDFFYELWTGEKRAKQLALDIANDAVKRERERANKAWRTHSSLYGAIWKWQRKFERTRALLNAHHKKIQELKAEVKRLREHPESNQLYFKALDLAISRMAYWLGEAQKELTK